MEEGTPPALDLVSELVTSLREVVQSASTSACPIAVPAAYAEPEVLPPPEVDADSTVYQVITRNQEHK
ncbi:hypothetical protein KOW79_012260 [Hemibagrus wyckioides]|uniref:Uncharacterized protein n=1 Tax=Hemibagrus wyckioides TaxID=337641 RepID=A0A9D3SM27_9TELE|nr:hypothetical protein KOW79_012260 [Hemibagrus wyckioides]